MFKLINYYKQQTKLLWFKIKNLPKKIYNFVYNFIHNFENLKKSNPIRVFFSVTTLFIIISNIYFIINNDFNLEKIIKQIEYINLHYIMYYHGIKICLLYFMNFLVTYSTNLEKKCLNNLIFYIYKEYFVLIKLFFENLFFLLKHNILFFKKIFLVFNLIIIYIILQIIIWSPIFKTPKFIQKINNKINNKTNNFTLLYFFKKFFGKYINFDKHINNTKKRINSIETEINFWESKLNFIMLLLGIIFIFIHCRDMFYNFWIYCIKLIWDGNFYIKFYMNIWYILLLFFLNLMLIFYISPELEGIAQDAEQIIDSLDNLNIFLPIVFDFHYYILMLIIIVLLLEIYLFE